MDDKRIGPVWVTKYALSLGIEMYDSARKSDDSSMIAIPRGNGLALYFHGEGREWHRTEAAAITRAKEMQLKRIKSLEQQIAKLKKLRFEAA